MPLFEYQCLACDRAFEQLVRGSAPRVACPACGSGRVRKLLSVPAPAVTAAAAAPGACGESGAPGGCCGGGMCQVN